MTTQSAQNSDLQTRLENLVFRNSTPFCMVCRHEAPSGRCDQCGTDDLGLKSAGEVDWHCSFFVETLLRDNFTPVDTTDSFEDSVRECFPETIRVGWIDVDVCSAIKELDPVSFRIAEGEWIDNEMSDERLTTFDSGSTYYWTSEIETFLDESESNDVSA